MLCSIAPNFGNVQQTVNIEQKQEIKKDLTKELTVEQIRVLERYKEIVNRLQQFPSNKLQQVQNVGFLKENYAEYFADMEFMELVDPEFQTIVVNPVLNSFILNDKIMLPQFLRFKMLKGYFPELEILEIVTEEHLPRGMIRNPDAGKFFTVTTAELQILDAARVLMAKIQLRSNQKIFQTTIELEFLMAHEKYQNRCFHLFENLIQDDIQTTTDNFTKILQMKKMV